MIQQFITKVRRPQKKHKDISIIFLLILSFVESTMDYIKRQRQRLEIINQEYSLSEFSEDDCVSMNMNTEEDAAAGKDQEALAAHIIDQCIPSNLSLPHH